MLKKNAKTRFPVLSGPHLLRFLDIGKNYPRIPSCAQCTASACPMLLAVPVMIAAVSLKSFMYTPRHGCLFCRTLREVIMRGAGADLIFTIQYPVRAVDVPVIDKQRILAAHAAHFTPVVAVGQACEPVGALDCFFNHFFRNKLFHNQGPLFLSAVSPQHDQGSWGKGQETALCVTLNPSFHEIVSPVLRPPSDLAPPKRYAKASARFPSSAVDRYGGRTCGGQAGDCYGKRAFGGWMSPESRTPAWCLLPLCLPRAQ